DRAIAAVSHLPHLLAFALARAAGELIAGADAADDVAGARAGRIAGPSFASATRVAASDPRLWAEVLSENREASLAALRTFRSRLDELEALLRSNAERPLAEWLARGRAVKMATTSEAHE